MQIENNKDARRIMLVGGASGGHFYPLIAIAESLRKSDPNVNLYYAGPIPYDVEALNSLGIIYTYVSAGKQRRYRSILNFFDLFRTFFGTCIAILKLFYIYPDVIMSKGGYTSVPVVFAAAFLRIPIIVHESDAVVGKANKIAAHVARSMLVSYTETLSTLKHPQVFLTGIPIRDVLLAGPSAGAIQTLGIDPERPLILVLGGSQGAERVNELILESLDELLLDFSVIHQAGKANYELCKLTADHLIKDETLRKHYHPVAFLSGKDLNDAYHVARIVISRAGSNSIYEIALHGKPSILIPIPEEISHDQRTNAYSYNRTGAGVVLEEKNLTDALLRAEIDRIMQNEAVYSSMSGAALSFGKRDASLQISQILLDVTRTH